jgi:H+/Cl- antiporter ClcA
MPNPFAKKIRLLPISPSMDTALSSLGMTPGKGVIQARVIYISVLAGLLAIASTLIAQGLTRLIGVITNIAFMQQVAFDFINPAAAIDHWGPWVIVVPVIGGVVVGVMARYGSEAIRGHGIPEAMEQILTNESQIPLRVTFLKPISAAITIGTGGPFGAEGPIIATGAALGSVWGRLFKTTVVERKTLLAAGAAAGMTATFGSPVSSVLLAVELLLFEFRPRSLIPVALAAAAAEATRIPFAGMGAVFHMPQITSLDGTSVLFYTALGAFIGLVSVLITKSVYAVEDAFEKLPIHWMWWPALGGIAVGVVGYFYPHTMGVGYDNIQSIISNQIAPATLAIFCLMKFISWAISLGSGTSGGTLAPLFTIGGGIGGLLGIYAQQFFPSWGVNPMVAALVGMAATFAGASRALLTSIVFAFETTQQPFGLLPLLAGCAASFMVASYFMRNSIMTEKIVRRGVHVPGEYTPDFLEQVLVSEFRSRGCISLNGADSVAVILQKLSSNPVQYAHQGYPVIDAAGKLQGVITRRELSAAAEGPEENSHHPIATLLKRSPVTVREHQNLREAADLMASEGIGRLVVVSDRDPQCPIGVITRSDLLRAHQVRIRTRKAGLAGSHHA